MKGKCIYCKEYKDLNNEHAFPNSLLQEYIPLGEKAPEWIIERLCENCNNERLGILDRILVTSSPMAFIWRRIQNEWEPNNTDKKSGSQASTFYNQKVSEIDPVRLFFLDPSYGNLALHEDAGISASGLPILRAQAPQMILTQYAKEQTKEEIIAENSKKCKADEFSIAESDEHEDVYCIFGNTYIFPPKVTRYFLTNRDTEDEFFSKFIKERDNIQSDLIVLSSDKATDLGKIKGFYNRCKADTKKFIEEENFEPKEFTQETIIIADPKAMPYLNRAVAKIAFHCFLYHYPKFSGHEPIFNDIKAFIEGKNDTTGKEFISSVKGPGHEVWDSNQHFHVMRFYINGDNILCQIAFFTGLLVGPFASGVTLAGDPDKATQSLPDQQAIPFYVHAKSELMRRIVLPR